MDRPRFYDNQGLIDALSDELDSDEVISVQAQASGLCLEVHTLRIDSFEPFR